MALLGNLEGAGSITGDFERQVIIWRAAPLGIPKDVKEGSGKGISIGASIGEPGGGLLYMGLERQVKEGSGNRASLSLSMGCEGNLEGGLLYWGP